MDALVAWTFAICAFVIFATLVDDWLRPPPYDDEDDETLSALKRAVDRVRDL